MASMAKQATARCALISALYTVALLLTPTAIGEAIIGSAWVDIKPTALALGLSLVGGAVVMGPLVLLRAIGMSTQLARLRLSLFPLQLALVALGVLWGGGLGAALGLAGGSWLSAPFWWVFGKASMPVMEMRLPQFDGHLLEFLQALRVRRLHPAVPGEPPMPGRLGGLEVAADLVEFLAGRPTACGPRRAYG